MALLGFITILLTLPLAAQAQFVPLSGIPGVTAGGGTLTEYINALFLLSISVGAIIAVVKIAYGGVLYMLSDVVTTKSEAKKEIFGALLGLAILLSAFIVLYTINDQLVNLNFLNAPQVDIGGQVINTSSWQTDTCPFWRIQFTCSQWCTSTYGPSAYIDPGTGGWFNSQTAVCRFPANSGGANVGSTVTCDTATGGTCTQSDCDRQGGQYVTYTDGSGTSQQLCSVSNSSGGVNQTITNVCTAVGSPGTCTQAFCDSQGGTYSGPAGTGSQATYSCIIVGNSSTNGNDDLSGLTAAQIDAIRVACEGTSGTPTGDSYVITGVPGSQGSTGTCVGGNTNTGTYNSTGLATSAFTSSSDAQSYYPSQANFTSLYNQYVASQEFTNVTAVQATVEAQAQAAGGSVLFITTDTRNTQDVNMQQQTIMCQQGFNGYFEIGTDSQGNAYRACIIP